MVKISIISLIYKSKCYADFVFNSLLKHTPLIRSGEAEFFFVANDPTDELLSHLDAKNYPYVLNINQKYSDEELFQLGYGTPNYMSSVYRGYNCGINHARGEMVVLINSDNAFSPDWLENLLKWSNRHTIISSQIVERNHPKHGYFPSALKANFGSSANNFNEDSFLEFRMKVAKTGLINGGAYMPCLFYKDVLTIVGGYPDGNVAGDSFNNVKLYGDEYLFGKLKEFGIDHFTSLDSIIYHFKEGEMDDSKVKSSHKNIGISAHVDPLTKARNISELSFVHPSFLPNNINWHKKSDEIAEQIKSTGSNKNSLLLNLFMYIYGKAKKR